MDQDLLLSFADLEDAHWWFVVRNQLALDAIADAAGPNPQRVLEVGCGTGGIIRRLAALFPAAAIKGIEPSSDAIAIARERGCTVSEGVLESLTMSDGSVDLVVALDVLEHCKDDVVAAREASRVLAPGGVFVLTVPAMPSLWGPHDVANAHVQRYTRQELAHALTEAGFTIEKLTYFNSLLLPLGYASRLLAAVTGSRAVVGMEMPWAPVNAMLRGVFSLERPVLRTGGFPIGMSLIAVARKPEVAQ